MRLHGCLCAMGAGLNMGFLAMLGASFFFPFSLVHSRFAPSGFGEEEKRAESKKACFSENRKTDSNTESPTLSEENDHLHRVHTFHAKIREIAEIL